MDALGQLVHGERVLANGPLTLDVGNLPAGTYFLHVKDAARALVEVALSDVTGAVNIASGVPVRLRDLVLAIADSVDARYRVRLGALEYRPNDPMFVCADVTKLRQATSFTPEYELADGIASTVDWWRKQGLGT